jgi:PAS domain-containing protein
LNAWRIGTDRHRTNGTARTSEAMKRSILNSLNTRIAVVDGKGVIVATNRSLGMFGGVNL